MSSIPFKLLVLTSVVLVGCNTGGSERKGDDDEAPSSSNTRCQGADCAGSTSGIECVDNAVNLSKLSKNDAVLLCRGDGRDSLYVCYDNAVKFGSLAKDDAILLCDNNNDEDAYLCVTNAVSLGKLTQPEALGLCDNVGDDDAYLCVINAKTNVSGMNNSQAIELCKNGAETDAFRCVLEKQQQGDLDVNGAVALCSIAFPEVDEDEDDDDQSEN